MSPRRLQFIVGALVVAILAMGFYLVHLKRKAEAIGGDVPSSQPLAAPVNGPPAELTLYIANDAQDTLEAVTVSSALPADAGERAKLALHTLLARYQQKDTAHPLAPGADVHDVYMLDPASAVVNLNAALANSHRSGIEVEQLTIFSIASTLKAQLPQLTRVHFLVEGKPRETLAGHVDLSGWIDLGAVVEASSQLK